MVRRLMMGGRRRVMRRGRGALTTSHNRPSMEAYHGPAFSGGRRRRVRRRGGNIFSKIGHWIKGAANTVYQKAIKPAWNYAKEQKLISKGLAMIPGVGGKVGSVIAGQLGVGRRRRRVHRRRAGGSLRSFLTSAHKFAKTHRVASKLARHAGFTGLAKAIHSSGYGRRRVRRRRAGGSLKSLLKSAHSFVKKHQLVSKGLTHAGFHKLAKGASSLGYGRRKVRRTRRVVKRRRGGNIMSKLRSFARAVGHGRRAPRRRIYRRRR